LEKKLSQIGEYFLSCGHFLVMLRVKNQPQY
jgi:hypothetical protein